MSNIKPIISIIVPVYNTAQYLRQCLDSLANQTMRDIEIICINDGSPDNALEVLNEYAGKDGRIKIIDQKNSGPSGARNSGLKIAQGQYLMFVDSDDWIDTAMCEALYLAANQENADVVMCSYTKEFGDHSVKNHIFANDCVLNEDEVKTQIYRKLFGLVGTELARPQDCDLIVSPCMQLFKCSISQEIDFVDTKKIGTEDCLYQIMVYQKCKKFVYLDKPFYHYRKTNGESFTTLHNPHLYERWQNLYDIMQNLIVENELSTIYEVALNNRIALSMLGLGLNEIAEKNKTIFEKAMRLKQILRSDRYEAAYSELEFRYFPFKWKTLFYLCKFRMTIPLVVMLELIDFLRKRIG